ncbi:Efk-1 [Aphelenchoides fujianensis]|nr:Efk-1 [Aphelenchoides fujianensis]
MSSKGKRGGRKAKVKQQEPAESGGQPHESLAADSELVGLDVLSWMAETVNFENSGWKRDATPQVLREQNKQLRSILPEGDGRDAQTAEELRERRQTAVKIRNEQLLESVGNALSQKGASSRPERTYRLDASVPSNWDAFPVQSGKFLAYQLPRSIDDVANGVPLERCRPEIASVQIAAHPFARGGERIAYFGRDLKANKDIVLKEYRHVTGAMEAGLRHEFANQQQTIASYFAAHYMAACQQKLPAERIPALLDFLMTKTLALGPMDNLRYMCVEPRLDPAVRYLRFTNNHDFVLPEACAVSDGKMMVVDLQGTITANTTAGSRPTVLLTDPAIHSEDRIRFGATNHSKLGMKAFFEQHHCNEFCEALQLPKVDAAQVLRG